MTKVLEKIKKLIRNKKIEDEKRITKKASQSEIHLVFSSFTLFYCF